MATETLNTPVRAWMAVPAAGWDVKTRLGAPAVGTWREAPEAVFHWPPLSEPLPAKKAYNDPATRARTTSGMAIRSTRFFMRRTTSSAIGLIQPFRRYRRKAI